LFGFGELCSQAIKFNIMKVGIIMGSDSDLPVMQEAAKILEQLRVSHEVSIVSAHRTPDRLMAYAKEAAGRGIACIIAGAGGAAHLPGMIASFTHLPVIGVPVQSKTMSGVDSLYSIVQMPPGVPVATVAINGAMNAGILAAQILSTADAELANRVASYKSQMETDVLAKAQSVESDWREHLKQRS
jgi:5-(carboxyamino)imidazole ribonucleotide mutase